MGTGDRRRLAEELIALVRSDVRFFTDKLLALRREPDHPVFGIIKRILRAGRSAADERRRIMGLFDVPGGLDNMIAVLKNDELDFQAKLQALRVDASHPQYPVIEMLLKKTAGPVSGHHRQ